MALNISGFDANISLYGPVYSAAFLAADCSDPTIVSSYYYDAARVFYQLGDYLHDASYYAAAKKAADIYIDCYLVPASYQAAGYWNFSQGLRLAYQRTHDPKYANACIQLSLNAAYAQDFSTNADVWDPDNYNSNSGGSREAAYAFMSHLDAELCGATRRQRTIDLTQALLHHLDVWATGLSYAYYVRPFMVALTSEAVIRGVGAGLIDEASAKAKIGAVITYLNSQCYDAPSKSYLYTDRIGVNPPDTWAAPEDGLPAPDLNLLIAPVLQWLGGSYTARAEDLFNGGVAGAWLGNAKQFNQNYRFSFELLRWASEQSQGEPTSPPAGNTENSWNETGCLPWWWVRGYKRAHAEQTQGSQPNPSDSPPDPTPTQSPFSAEDFGNTILYLDYTDSTKLKNASATQALDTEPIAQVLDKSVSGFDLSQSTNAYRAVVKTNEINLLQVASFSGGQGYEVSLSDMSTLTKNRTGLTLVLVAKLTDFTALQILLRATTAAGTRLDFSFLAASANMRVQMRPQDASVITDDYGDLAHLPALNAWNVFIWSIDFAGNKLDAWMGSQKEMTVADIHSTGNTSNTDCVGADSNILFFNDYGSAGIVGDIGEFFIYSAALPAGTVTSLVAALSTKYGVTF